MCVNDSNVITYRWGQLNPVAQIGFDSEIGITKVFTNTAISNRKPQSDMGFSSDLSADPQRHISYKYVHKDRLLPHLNLINLTFTNKKMVHNSLQKLTTYHEYGFVSHLPYYGSRSISSF